MLVVTGHKRGIDLLTYQSLDTKLNTMLDISSRLAHTIYAAKKHFRNISQ